MPTVLETWVQSLGQDDLLEKEMATHSSILAWKIPWTVEPGRLQSMGLQRVRHNRVASLIHSLTHRYVAYWIIFVYLFIYFLLTTTCITVGFLISAAFDATHSVWKVVFPFSLVSRYFMISSLSSSLKDWFFSTMFCLLVFALFFLLFKTFINRCLQFVDFFFLKNQAVNFYYKLKMTFLKIST